MPYTVPQPIWAGADVYVIGGGPSLKDFDWNLLKGLKTIGCNDAYLLGADICKVCVFGDVKWWNHHKEGLAAYEGVTYAAEPKLAGKSSSAPPWLLFLERKAKGLQTDSSVGWNGSTGYVALNLAFHLGAARVYLLGFDMKRTPEASNWHINTLDKNPNSVYAKFLDWSKFVKKDYEEKFSHIEVINVTDDSDLTIFPKVSAKNFWLQRKTA